MTVATRLRLDQWCRPSVCLLAGFCLFAALGLSGCAAATARPTNQRPGGDAVAALLRDAQADRTVRPVDLAPPPGIDAALVQPRSADDTRAWLGLPEAVARLSEGFEPPPKRSVAAPSPEVAVQTTRLYLRAREQHLEGQFFESVRTAEQLLRLDPGSVAAMHLLARNHLATVGTARALAQYEEILRIDSDDVEALVRIGTAAWQRRETARAAARLGRAYKLLGRDEPRSAVDYDLWLLTSHELGRLLLANGCDTAGVGVWQPLLVRLPDFPPRSGRFQREIDRLYRTLPDTYRELGDAFARLARFDDAIEAYEESLSAAQVGEEALLPRLVWALFRAGRVDAALGRLLLALDEADPVAPVLELVQHVGAAPQSRRLADALKQRLAEHPDRVHYVQALASMLSPPQSDALIMAHLEQHASEPETVKALLPWAIGTDDARLPLRLIIRQAPATADGATVLVNELKNLVGDVRPYLEAWNALPNDFRRLPEAQQVRVWLLIESFEFDRARRELETQLSERPNDAALRLAHHALLSILMLRDEARESLESIDVSAMTSVEPAYVLARTWVRQGDHDRALAVFDEIEARVAAEPDFPFAASFDSMDHRHRKGQLLVGAGQPEEAARLFSSVLAKDPARESAHVHLLQLHGPGGALTDPQRYGEVVRSLFAHAPNGRAMRLIRAGDDVNRGRFDDAITAYQTLLSESITDAEAIAGLLRAWLMAGRAAEAAAWFEQQYQRRPGDTRLRRAWIESLLADRRLNDAVEHLRELTQRQPGDIESWRRLEEILRSGGRDIEAHEAARRRWRQLPESLPQALALAEIDAADARAESSLTHLRRAVALADRLLERHLDRIIAIARQLRDTTVGDEAREFIEHTVAEALRRAASPSQPVLMEYLRALTDLNRPLDRLLSALEDTKEAGADTAFEQVTLVIVELHRHERFDDACAVADRWFGEERRLEEREIQLVDWRLAQALERDEPQRVISLIHRVHESGIEGRLAFLRSRRDPDDRYDPLAESFYVAAGHFYLTGHKESYERLLIEALRVDPDHAFANNNLAYTWVDRDERLEEAEQMLIKAIKAEPESSEILDSLGWVRYKLGVFDGDADHLHEQGAIPLLERAIEARRTESRRSGPEDDPVILDHLGDACWRAGRTEEAVAAWRRALNAAESLFAEERGHGDEERLADLERHYGPVADAARAKIEAADAGKDPPVASAPGVEPRMNTDERR